LRQGEGKHAIQTHCRQQRRERGEGTGQCADQAIGEHVFADHHRQCGHLGHRQVGVDLGHHAFERRQQRIDATGGPDIKAHGPDAVSMLSPRDQKLRRDLILDLAVFGIGDQANDLDVQLVARSTHCHPFADHVFTHFELAGEGLVDDRHHRPIGIVGRSELPAAQQRDTQGVH